MTQLFDFSTMLSSIAVANLEHSIGNPINPRMVAAIQSAQGLINLGSGTPDLPHARVRDGHHARGFARRNYSVHGV